MTTEFETKKEQLVKEIFIDTADEDYITARWLFLNHLHRQFFWSAAQSLEKYLKAALLLNGRSAKENIEKKQYRHNLVKLFETVSQFASDLIPPQLAAPPQVALYSQNKDLWGNPITKDFISHINEYGDPNNRYDYFGIQLEASDLHKLDQIVFALRNITFKLDAPFDPGTPTITFADQIRKHPDKQFRRFEEHLIAEREKQPSLYESARENNFPFAPTYDHQELPLIIRGSVSTLEIIFKNPQLKYSAQLQQWAKDNIKLYDSEIKRLKRS